MSITTIILVAGVVMFIIEIFTPSFIFGSVGVGCFCAAAASYFELSNQAILAIGICGTIVTMFAIRPIFLKYLNKSGEQVQTNVDAYVGRTTIALEPINSLSGSVKLDGVVWQARSADGATIEKDSQVVVEKTDSIILIVKSKN